MRHGSLLCLNFFPLDFPKNQGTNVRVVKVEETRGDFLVETVFIAWDREKGDFPMVTNTFSAVDKIAYSPFESGTCLGPVGKQSTSKDQTLWEYRGSVSYQHRTNPKGHSSSKASYGISWSLCWNCYKVHLSLPHPAFFSLLPALILIGNLNNPPLTQISTSKCSFWGSELWCLLLNSFMLHI